MSRSDSTPPTGAALARAAIPLASAAVSRPWAHNDGWQGEAVAHWQSLLDAGLIPVLSTVEGGGNPPPSPEIVAQRDANDALFRGFAADRRRLAQIAGRL